MIANFIGGGAGFGGFGFTPPTLTSYGWQFGINNGVIVTDRHFAKLILISIASTATGAEGFSGPVGTGNTNPTIAITDSKGNTYVALPPTTANAGTTAAVQHQFVYCVNPAMDWGPSSSGFTEEAVVDITMTGVIGQLFTIHIDRFSGVASELTQVLATLTSGSSVSTSPITPTRLGALIYTGLASKGAVSSGSDKLLPTGYVKDVGGSDPDINGSVGYHSETVNALVPITHTWFWTGTHAPACMGTVLFAPISAAVPNVVGMTPTAAIAAITAAGFAVGAIAGRVGSTVTSQVPAAGVLAPIKDPSATFAGLWKVDLTLDMTPADCLMWSEDWSPGNSLFTSETDYSRSSDGVDPLYPIIEAAYSVTIVDGELIAAAPHADDWGCSVEFAHMGPFYGGGGSLTSYYGSPGFWSGHDGAIEFTYTPNDVTVAQYGLLVSIEDYMLTLEYDPDDGYWIQAYSWEGDVSIEGAIAATTVSGVPYRWRIEWQCSSGPYSDPVAPAALDGYLRIFRDGEMVFEQTDVDLYLNGDSTTPDNLMHTVVFGDGSLFGALDDVVIACAAFASEPPATEYEPAADTGLTWAEWELEDEVVGMATARTLLIGPAPRTAVADGTLVFTFGGEYPMKFCDADGVEVPSPTPGARIGDDDSGSYRGGIMVLDSGIFGATAVKHSGAFTSQVWSADVSTRFGEIFGLLNSIASNRTDRFYGWIEDLSPAPDGNPKNAGTLPQPPVPTGISITVALTVQAAGSATPPGFYEFAVMLITYPCNPHTPGQPSWPADVPDPPTWPSYGNVDAGELLIGPLASLTVPATTETWATGWLFDWTCTFPNPATMSPYFSGGWLGMCRKNGGPWSVFGSSSISPADYDGVLPYPGYPQWGGYGPGRFVGTVHVSNAAIGGAGGWMPYPYPYPPGNTTGTGPWYDLTLVEFDDHGMLTGRTWILAHSEGNRASPTAIAVDRDMSVAYYDRYDSTTTQTTIIKVSLSDLTASTFATTPPETYLYTANSIRVLSNGDVLVLLSAFDDAVTVRRYSSAGALLATYPVTGNAQESKLAHGADDTTFWVCYTDTDTYIDRLVCFDVATGAVLHEFDSPWFVDEDWNYTDSPFCVTPASAPVPPEYVLSADAGLTWVEIED